MKVLHGGHTKVSKAKWLWRQWAWTSNTDCHRASPWKCSGTREKKGILPSHIPRQNSLPLFLMTSLFPGSINLHCFSLFFEKFLINEPPSNRMKKIISLLVQCIVSFKKCHILLWLQSQERELRFLFMHEQGAQDVLTGQPATASDDETQLLPQILASLGAPEDQVWDT